MFCFATCTRLSGMLENCLKSSVSWDFPDDPVVETLPSNGGAAGLIPGGGAEIPQASGPREQNIK